MRSWGAKEAPPDFLARQVSAIYDQWGTGDERGLVRRKEENCVSDLLGLRVPSDGLRAGRLAPELRYFSLRGPLKDVGLDVAGTHTVDANAVRCVARRE